jgi:hypothetical protein
MSRRILWGLALAAAMAACSPSASTPGPSESSESSEPSVEPSVSPSVAPSQRETGWRELSPPGGPAAREDATWTVGGDGSVAYLFGGRAGASLFNDLWAYDLATDSWETVAATGAPPPRFGHNAAWVEGTGLVVFAGQGVGGFFNDLWAFDPGAGSWRQLPAAGAAPVPRYGSCAALGPDGRLWISHGFTSELARFDDTRAYDFATGTWTDESPPGTAPIQRCLHGCWWTDGELHLYGGQTDGVVALGDWWTLSGATGSGTAAWAEVPIGGSGLPARNLYALTAYRGGHLVFGGQALDASYLADAWLIDHEGAPAAAPSGPSGRSGAEMVTDEGRDRVLLFGGRDASSHFGDVWELTVP